MNPARVALICSFAHESAHSMNVVAEMLRESMNALPEPTLHMEEVRPKWTIRQVPFVSPRLSQNADRILNRHWEYPRYLRRRAGEFEFFHVSDHAYAQLVHALPKKRTGVYCHDLEAWRCVLEPARDPRPLWFRAIARRALTGLQKAAVVFHSTHQVRQEIERHGLVPASRLVHAPYGVSPEFSYAPDPAVALPPAVAALGDAPFLLHVGSCFARKRIDVLLTVFARLRQQRPELRLVKVGNDWAPSDVATIQKLGLEDGIVPLRNLTRPEIAALYRAAAVVLMPSEVEGFGLPIIEALACGSVVVASDIPVLREVGGDAVVYCPVGDVSLWADTVRKLLSGAASAPPRDERLRQASHYTWANHARIIRDAYLRLR